MVRSHIPFLLAALLVPLSAGAQPIHEAAPLPGLARGGARAVLLPDQQRILLYGGGSGDYGAPHHGVLEELWSYDLVTDRWESIAKAGPWPGPRAGHDMAPDGSGTGFFLYGGRTQSPDDYACGNQLWHFASVSDRWELVASGLRNAPAGAQSGMGSDPETGDPWVFFGLCGIGSCNWYSARFALPDERWDGVGAPRDSIPGGSVSPTAPYDPRRRAFLLRGGRPPRGCFDLPDANQARPDAEPPTLHSMWLLDPRSQGWNGMGTIAQSPLRQGLPLSDYDPLSDSYLEYGGSRGEGGAASDSLWSFDLEAQTWSLLVAGAGRSRPRYDAAGRYCPCTGEMFVATGAESAFGEFALRSDAYFLRVESRAQFEWDGAANQRHAPWRWGSVMLEEDGEIQPGSVRLMNCAQARDLQPATEVRRIGRGRWHVRFAAATPEEQEALAAGHLILTGRVQGQAVNFLARLSGNAVARGPLRPSALDCEPVAGGWRVRYAGEHPESARLQVFDVAGKMLARYDAPFASGNSFVWDGRDDGGRRLPNGIYFLRAGSGGTAKAVLIR